MSISEPRSEPTAVLTAVAVSLLGKYCDALDHQRYAEWADLFAADGRFEYPPRTISGRDALIEFAATSPRGVHLSGVPVLTQSGEVLSSVSSWIFVNIGTGSRLAGYYHDQFIETDRGWRFLVRRVEMLSPPATP